VTPSFAAFCAISYICAITTVVPQVMLPLVAELAPAHQRALALTITTSGNLLGIVIARLLSGVVTQFTSWRNVYWIALALQYLILIALWLFMPDYPSSNPQGLNYFKMLGGIILLYKKHAILVQAGIISFCISASFTSFWTTLTFLLADPPYNYSPVVIGLFALIGIGGILGGPVYAKYIIQPYAPMFSCVTGCLANLIGIIIGTYSGKHTVAGPIVSAASFDTTDFDQPARASCILQCKMLTPSPRSKPSPLTWPSKSPKSPTAPPFTPSNPLVATASIQLSCSARLPANLQAPPPARGCMHEADGSQAAVSV
jgi:predicted MFS family arabinose efflux permease